MLDLTGNIIVPGAAILTMFGLAMWVGRKLQQIENALLAIGKIAGVVEEHCARIHALEQVVQFLREEAQR